MTMFSTHLFLKLWIKYAIGPPLNISDPVYYHSLSFSPPEGINAKISSNPTVGTPRGWSFDLYGLARPSKIATRELVPIIIPPISIRLPARMRALLHERPGTKEIGSYWKVGWARVVISRVWSDWNARHFALCLHSTSSLLEKARLEPRVQLWPEKIPADGEDERRDSDIVSIIVTRNRRTRRCTKCAQLAGQSLLWLGTDYTRTVMYFTKFTWRVIWFMFRNMLIRIGGTTKH